MRVFVSVALVVFLLEAILILAFVVGYYWIGGWVPGALLCGIVLLLIVMPWIGDLEVLFDSAKGALEVRLGWWGSARVRLDPTVEVRGRLLLIPLTRRPRARGGPARPEEPEHEAPEAGTAEESRPQEPGGRRPPRRAPWRAVADRIRDRRLSLEKVGDLLLAGGHAAQELLWRAKDLAVVVHSPTGSEAANAAIAGLVGHRTLGPVDLKCASTGSRRVRIFYRIGLLRAAFVLFLFIVEGRPPRRAARPRRAEAQPPARTAPPSSELTEAE